MSSTGSKVIQGIALVVGIILIVAGVRQCTNKADDVSTTPATGASSTTGVVTSTSPTTIQGAGAATTTTAVRTTITLTTTTLQPMTGTFSIEPAGASFAANYPYPGDPAQPGTTPIVDWNIAVPAGQKIEIRGPAPGTADAVLSPVAQGQFVPCPGAIKEGICEVAAGSYTYSAVLLEGDTVVAKKTAILQVGGATSTGGGAI